MGRNLFVLAFEVRRSDTVMMASACLALSGAALALVPTSHVLPGQCSRAGAWNVYSAEAPAVVIKST